MSSRSRRWPPLAPRSLAVLAGLLLAGAGCVPPMAMHANDVAADSAAVLPAVPSLSVGRILGPDRAFELRTGGFASLGPQYSQSIGPNFVSSQWGPQLEGAIRIGKVLVALGGAVGLYPRTWAKPGTQTPQGAPFVFALRVEGQMLGRDDFDIGWEVSAMGQDSAYHFGMSTVVNPYYPSQTIQLPDMSGDAFHLEAGFGVTPEMRVGPVRVLAGLYFQSQENGDLREQFYGIPPSDQPGTSISYTLRAGVEIPIGVEQRHSILVDGYYGGPFPPRSVASWWANQYVLSFAGLRLAFLERF